MEVLNILLIKNGHIIDPSQGIDEKGDILIEDGCIKKIRRHGAVAEDHEKRTPILRDVEVNVVDAEGLFVLPGLVDMHVHLREPGYEHKETIKTGTMAAVKGGFTSVCCMPNTNPVNDNETVTEFILRKVYAVGSCYVYPIGAVTKSQKGKELSEMGMMKEAGCVGFSDDGFPVMNGMIMRRALEYSKTFSVPVISHAEDKALSSAGVMNEGPLSASLGLEGIPREAEIIMIERDIRLAALTGGKLHIAHISTAEGVNAVREAKKSGIDVTAETCPHYFILTEDAIKGYNTNAKVNPPLRTALDIEAIKEGLSDGTIDVIATDHAPHHPDDKICEFDRAAPGISGLETALPLSLRLVEEGILTLSGLVEKTAFNPARILNLEKGTLKEGADGDIVLVDTKSTFRVESERFISMGKNTPFEGFDLKGRAVKTICKDRIFDFDGG